MVGHLSVGRRMLRQVNTGRMGMQVSQQVNAAARVVAAAGTCLILANCASSDKFSSRVDPKYGVSSSPRVVGFGEPVPRGGGTYRVGKPYTVGGRVYVPEENTRYRAEGLASWYGDDFHGRFDGQRRGLRHDIADRRASDDADPELCSRHQYEERQVADRARQRPRPLPRQPSDRCCRTARRRCSNSRIPASPGCASNMSAALRSRARTTANLSRHYGPTNPRHRLRPCVSPPDRPSFRTCRDKVCLNQVCLNQAASRVATSRCRKAGPIRSETPPPMSLRSMRRRTCLHRAGLVTAAPCPTIRVMSLLRPTTRQHRRHARSPHTWPAIRVAAPMSLAGRGLY